MATDDCCEMHRVDPVAAYQETTVAADGEWGGETTGIERVGVELDRKFTIIT
jgi:hypothetical protein